MSKARLVLTALFVDRQTPTEVARRYGVHRSWVYRLKARFEAEGEAAFEPRSRRPATSPTAIADATVELIVQLRKELAEAGWTPARTPSSGTCSSATGCALSRDREWTGSAPRQVSSSRSLSAEEIVEAYPTWPNSAACSASEPSSRRTQSCLVRSRRRCRNAFSVYPQADGKAGEQSGTAELG
jgi:Winged helix-turn helix